MAKRTMSAAARRRVSEAAKRYWAAYRARKGTAAAKRGRPAKASAATGRRTMSPAARRRIAAAQRARWAAYRAGKPSTGARSGKRGRPRKAVNLDGNRYLQMTVAALVAAKRQMDEAWRAAVKAMRRG